MLEKKFHTDRDDECVMAAEVEVVTSYPVRGDGYPPRAGAPPDPGIDGPGPSTDWDYYRDGPGRRVAAAVIVITWWSDE